MQRAIEARERADGLQRDARQLAHLGQILREAAGGRVLLRRCAWCDAFKVGDEWLRLEAIGQGQQRITGELRARATNGICPGCFDAEMRSLEARRAKVTKT